VGCGPTLVHLSGLSVRYVSNITDIDDKIIARANDEGRSESDVVKEYEGEWWDAMSRLGVKEPDDKPHATDYVGDMVELISAFLERDVAYVTSDGVYFDVSTVSDYGLLAGQPLDTLRAGERVEVNGEKRSPLDFALWKNAKPGEPRWPAPFGEGRPGWHTECVVMSLDLLAKTSIFTVEGWTSSSRTTRTNEPRPKRRRFPLLVTGDTTDGSW